MADKVLQIGKYYKPYKGGIEAVTEQISQAMNNNNIKNDVCIFSDKTYSDFSSNHSIYGFKKLFTLISQPFSFSYIYFLILNIRRYSCLVVHYPNIIAVILVLLFKCSNQKLVVFWHSDIVSQKILKKIFNIFDFLLLCRSDVIIATSPNYVQGSNILKRFLHKIEVVPLSTVCREICENNVSEDIRNIVISNDKYLLSIGRLIEYKGFDYLIKSLSYSESKLPLIIVGKGPLESYLKSLVCNLNLEDSVIFLGGVTDNEKNFLLKNSYLFCLGSFLRSEAFGVVILESFSHSVPAITFDIPDSGVPWVNSNNFSGITVPNKNYKVMASEIDNLVYSPDLRESLSLGARFKFTNYFNEETFNKNILNILTQQIFTGGKLHGRW